MKLASILRRWADKLDPPEPAPYAVKTPHGWTIHTPGGIPLAKVTDGRET